MKVANLKTLIPPKKGDPPRNPKGKPKGTIGVRSSLRKILNSDGKIILDKKFVKKIDSKTYQVVLPKSEAIAMRVMSFAMGNKGSEALKAIGMIMDNTEGLLKQDFGVNKNIIFNFPKGSEPQQKWGSGD